MDFFNSKPTTSASNPNDGLATPGFREALNQRFSANATSSLLTSAFTPAVPLQTPMLPLSAASPRSQQRFPIPRMQAIPQGAIAGPSVGPLPTQNNQAIATPSLTASTALSPERVVSLTNVRGVLVIDIRPHVQFQTSRIPGAVSLVVPSTLLKRLGFSLEKMAEMIEDPSARNRFERWRSMTKLVIYDVDTSFLADGTNLAGLLRKFQASGYQGELYWVKGGFTAFARNCPSAVDTAAMDKPDGVRQEVNNETFLRARNLSTHAFQQSSTTLIGQKTPRGSEHFPAASSASVAANPFYDNIRQNIELSQGVDTRIPLALPAKIIARRNELPFKWLRDIVDQNIEDQAGETLAMQFYRIELGEQRRMQGVMAHHSTESNTTPNVASSSRNDDYPYSITAGIEMGSKNRYRNIWPFEHARVRLPKSKGGSDYFNASFVQSLVSSRRYIATQGPLDSTYDDFWAICWAYEVPVIVMLTREIESSLIKCGKYWKDGQYGDITLKLLSQEGVDEDKTGPSAKSGGFFSAAAPPEAVQDTIVERVFQLTNRAQPHLPPRRITHLQYLGWADMDVPQSPGGLLTLIRRTNFATNDHLKSSLNPKQGPVLLHCSAGVGRTGGFLLVDSILAGIRHEMARNGSPFGQLSDPENSSPDDMEIDESESVKPSRQSLRSSPPDDISSQSSSVPISTSGSERVSKRTTHSSRLSSLSSRQWSKHPTRGSLATTKHSGLTTPSPRKLSDLVAENLRMSSHSPPSATSQVAAWSKKLETPSRSLKDTPPAPTPNAMPSTEDLQTKGGINYKLPRKLDELRGSPPMPSSFSEPVRDVLEDMREQRMSLCQSLRQYVFAHRAILAGALELVDEAAEAKRQEAKVSNVRMTSIAPGAHATSEAAWSSTSSVVSSTVDAPPSSSPTRAMAGRLSYRDPEGSQGSSARSSPPLPPKPSTGKRSASPVGTNNRDKTLLKRPSLKRKHKTEDSTTDDIPRPLSTRQHTMVSGSQGR
ncbi:hypothetical protein M408DRAFT_325568 [Serendipita vermifera MAFF 305830]|uniref:protein-tyrosine-phosphatase n=1 Tax=Serendipita vermifera MAFF 305830 TaxID=933852 RepID=A0A0C2XYV7_SERVB|nr:hypothetical protein M408DRAFT_325568 [Serendipita vermifera MAFF 305830]